VTADQRSLATILDGWNGYNESIVHAIEGLTPEQLTFRPVEGFRSVGELARHISLGRLDWFMRMDAPGSAQLVADVREWASDGDGNRHIVEAAVVGADNAADLARSLRSTWSMIEATLAAWTPDDLAEMYHHTYGGTVYAVSRQWTLFRILAHDMHHGGQLSLMLGQLGVEAFELVALGGHIVSPPTA
jgi:uncharacterized damage-inducible protein DinB